MLRLAVPLYSAAVLGLAAGEIGTTGFPGAVLHRIKKAKHINDKLLDIP